MKLNYLFLITALLMFIFISCSKDKKNDPTPTPAIATCSDGIQNQGETGVDCGGPCPPCATSLCIGNGSNEYFPLKEGNEWHYSYPGAAPDLKLKISGTQVINNVTYLKMDTEWGGLTNERFYRVDTNGDVYRFYSSGERLEVPANPVVNQTWTSGSYEWKVMSISASITTPNCTYTNCLRIQESSGTTVINYYNYKKGLGLVQDGTSPFTNNLKYLQLY